ncbi:uncharacterized protein LOC134694079 [Mytilus trossulus]|uniref:uncharacterized protein LOC134694079 n=1 Tax=Mytilus trossulus TaxID=6551 RepID=UPI0030074821
MELAAELKCCSELAISNSQKIESLETETTKQEEDNIPKNIRAQHNQDIKVWEDDECTFLKTRATYHILKSLPSNDCIIVTGSSGCGKSSNIHHAALQLRDRWGYEIIPVLTGPIDIINYYNESKKQVFVVDDICGKESINIQTLNNWRDNSERLEKIFKTVEHETNSTFSQITGSKLMISCRLHIYKEEQFQLFKLLTRKECNLLSTDMCLLQDERKLMLEKYIPKAITDSVMKVDEKVDFFPLLCKLAKCKTTKEVIELFTAPVDSIIENINHIVSEKKEQFFALALCLLFDDKFNTDWLKLKSISAEEKKDRLADILKEFEIDLSKEMQRNALKSGFTTLEGTYLKKIGSEYRIIHDKIHEMAAVTCGQRLPECFIKYAPPEFIRDHFIFKSVIEGPVKNDVILLSFDTEKEYFERLLSDLKKKSASCGYLDLVQFLVDTVKCNVNFKNESPALYKALEGGKTDVVKFLCENNASVSKWNMYGNSPLHLACKGGFTDTAELLLENNADVAKCNDSGESPLYVACRGGHVNTVKLLLLYNASVSQCDKHGGRSPLHIVCDRGNADVNLCDKEAHTPLDTARNSEFSEIVTLLEESLGLQTPHLK